MVEPCEDTHYYEPASGHGLAHDPFNAIVAPRPIGWIGSRSAASDAGGVANLAPYSFFNAVAYRPPTVMFSSEGWKDSVANIEATGVFTWNLATRAMAEAMNATSAAVAPGVDEFEMAGIAVRRGMVVDAPLVARAPAVFECRLTAMIRLKTAAGVEMNNWIVTGEVVAVHLARSFIREGIWDTAAARPILRGGGPTDYFELGEKFAMRRPAQER